MTGVTITRSAPGTERIDRQPAVHVWLAAAAVVAGGLFGCVPAEFESVGSLFESENDEVVPEEDLGMVSLPLNGTIIWDDANPQNDCSNAEKTKIQNAMAIAVEQVVNTPWRLRYCLRNAIVSPDNGMMVEVLMNRLQENLPTTVYCQDATTISCGGTNGWNACASVGIATERFAFGHNFLSGATDVRAASVMLHELVHNKGLRHPGGTEYTYTANEQVERCVQSVDAGNRDVNGPERWDMADESELAQVGGSGGNPFAVDCGAGRFMTDLKVRHDAFINRFEMKCSDISDMAQNNWAGTGRNAGETHTQSCGAGQVAVGLRGKGWTFVDAVGLMCLDLADVQDGRRAYRPYSHMGGDGGLDFYRWCPAGMAIKRIVGRKGDFIDQMRIVCQNVHLGDTGTRSARPAIGSSEGSGNVREREYCSDHGAMVGLFGRITTTGTPTTVRGVKRLGGVCAPVESGLTFVRNAGWPIRFLVSRFIRRVAGAETSIFPAAGGLDGASAFAGVRQCEADEALIGVKAWTSSNRIAAVTGTCVNTQEWTATANPLAAPATHDLDVNGPTYGSSAESNCARGQFVAGLEVLHGKPDAASDDRRVHRVRAICRDFKTW